jgi:hypothetical protein
MPEPTPEAWAKIRHDYEHTDRPIEDICAEHGISVPKLRYRIKRWGWNRRKLPIPREGPPPVARIERQPTTVAAWETMTPAPTLPLSGGGSEIAAHFPAGGDADDPLPSKEREENAPAAIVPRLQSAVARVLPAIEATIARLAGGANNPRDMEQASRALGSLTRTLRELNALLAQHKGRLEAAHDDDDDMPEDLDAFRYELARRINAFVASRTNEDGAQPDSGPGDEPQK